MRIMPTYLSGLIGDGACKIPGDYQLLKGMHYPCLVFLIAKYVALDWIGSKNFMYLRMVPDQRMGPTIVGL